MFAAAPAVAKTTLNKSHQLCEAAAKAQEPAPKTVRADKDQTRFTDAVVTVTLKVKNADDSSTVVKCTVDRETSAPTLTPVS